MFEFGPRTYNSKAQNLYFTQKGPNFWPKFEGIFIFIFIYLFFNLNFNIKHFIDYLSLTLT